jgi:hypothetical protein
MRKSKLNIVASLLLLAAFSTFNVGIPIVTYLCPMMSMENSCCEMIPPANHGTLSITSEIPNCCTSHIVAERNTTPYLSVEQLRISHLFPLYQVAHISNDAYIVDGQSLLTGVSFVTPSPLFSEKVSLSIFNSTLLI